MKWTEKSFAKNEMQLSFHNPEVHLPVITFTASPKIRSLNIPHCGGVGGGMQIIPVQPSSQVCIQGH